MLIDTHAHLDFEEYKNDFDTVWKEIQSAGVNKVIIPGVEPCGFENIIKFLQIEGIYGALGVHPSCVKEWNEDVAIQIKKLANHKKIVAIGEIGLDYHWDKTNVSEQKEVFISQIELAKELRLPIIVHDREAHEDTLSILKKTNAKEVGVVLHCFSGSVEFAKECIKEGFLISLGGVVTFKNAKKPQEVAKEINLSYLMLETDSPYLTPEPYRGKTNTPAYLPFVAQKIADLRNISREEVSNITTQNAIKFFGLN